MLLIIVNVELGNRAIVDLIVCPVERITKAAILGICRVAAFLVFFCLALSGFSMFGFVSFFSQFAFADHSLGSSESVIAGWSSSPGSVIMRPFSLMWAISRL